MLKKPSVVNVNHENNNCFNEHFFNNLNCYTIELNVENISSTKVHHTSICITIPLREIILILKVNGFDKNKNIKYELLGKVQPENFSKENVTMVQLSLIDNFKIINIKEVYRSRRKIGYILNNKNDEQKNNFGFIYDICNFIVRSFMNDSCSDLKQYADVNCNNSLV